MKITAGDEEHHAERFHFPYAHLYRGVFVYQPDHPDGMQFDVERPVLPDQAAGKTSER